MVRHDDECFEFVVLQMLRAVVDGIHYQLRDGSLVLVVADRGESPRKKKKAEMNLGSAGLTACATIK